MIDYGRKKPQWDDSTHRGQEYISEQEISYLLALAEDTTVLKRERRKPALAHVPDDLATQRVLHVREAAGCEENHNADNDEAQDDELDEACFKEITADKMHGSLMK